MDLSPEAALTMLTAVAKCHILAVFKYKVHPNCQSNIYRSANKSSDNCVYTNAGKIWISNKKCVHIANRREKGRSRAF